MHHINFIAGAEVVTFLFSKNTERLEEFENGMKFSFNGSTILVFWYKFINANIERIELYWQMQ